MTVQPATLVDILGQENLASGFGISTAVSGPANMLILPAAGMYHAYCSALPLMQNITKAFFWKLSLTFVAQHKLVVNWRMYI